MSTTVRWIITSAKTRKRYSQSQADNEELKELPKESRISERNTKQQLKEVVVKFKKKEKSRWNVPNCGQETKWAKSRIMLYHVVPIPSVSMLNFKTSCCLMLLFTINLYPKLYKPNLNLNCLTFDLINNERHVNYMWMYRNFQWHEEEFWYYKFRIHF
jgi:hypothetical protein